MSGNTQSLKEKMKDVPAFWLGRLEEADRMIQIYSGIGTASAWGTIQQLKRAKQEAMDNLNRLAGITK